MRIAHLCLSCFYIDSFSYQENILPRYHKNAGHEVIIIASTETYLPNGKLGYTAPGEYINEDGIRVVRVKYRGILPFSIIKKLRIHPGIYRLLQSFSPDIILFHGLCGWEILTAARYKKNHQPVRLYADSHEDVNNSAKTPVSRYILHGIYYKQILKHALTQIDKVLYVSLETRGFISDVYGISDSKMAFFPLGGVVYSDEQYYQKRDAVRSHLKITDNELLILQAGKFNKRKKVLESMASFSSVKDEKLRLVLIGSVSEEIENTFFQFLNRDKRIMYLGWKESSELLDYLCAADVYLQPGSQSALLQNAICLRCPVIIDNVLSHQPYVKGNGWLLNDANTLSHVLSEISRHPRCLIDMSKNSLKIANSLLDYKILAQKIIDGHF